MWISNQINENKKWKSLYIFWFSFTSLRSVHYLITFTLNSPVHSHKQANLRRKTTMRLTKDFVKQTRLQIDGSTAMRTL